MTRYVSGGRAYEVDEVAVAVRPLDAEAKRLAAAGTPVRLEFAERGGRTALVRQALGSGWFEPVIPAGLKSRMDSAEKVYAAKLVMRGGKAVAVFKIRNLSRPKRRVRTAADRRRAWELGCSRMSPARREEIAAERRAAGEAQAAESERRAEQAFIDGVRQAVGTVPPGLSELLLRAFRRRSRTWRMGREKESRRIALGVTAAKLYLDPSASEMDDPARFPLEARLRRLEDLRRAGIISAKELARRLGELG